MTKKTNSAQVVIPLGLAVCFSLFGDLSLFTVLVTQVDEIGITVAQVGILLSIHRLIRIPGNPIAGALVERFGRRWFFILGMLLAVASTAGYAVFTGFPLFLLSRLMWGFAWIFINVAGMNIILDISDTHNRGQLSGFYNAAIWAGYALGPFIGGLLVDTIAFRSTMLILAGFSALGLLSALIWLPETSSIHRQDNKDTDKKKNTDIWSLLVGGYHLMRKNASSRLAMSLMSITRFIGDGIVLSTITLLLINRFGEQIRLNGWTVGVVTASGLLLGVQAILSGMMGPIGGKISDSSIGRLPVMMISLLVGAIGFGLLAFGQSVYVIGTGIVLSSIAGGVLISVLVAYMGDHTRRQEQGVALGAFATAGDFGSMLGPAVAFALIPWLGLKWVYIISIVVYIAGALLVTLRMQKEQQLAPVPNQSI